jgi:hypothetical protein
MLFKIQVLLAGIRTKVRTNENSHGAIMFNKNKINVIILLRARTNEITQLLHSMVKTNIFKTYSYLCPF